MSQCPNCQSQVKPEERFCGNCGARLTRATAPLDQPAAPQRPNDQATVILPDTPGTASPEAGASPNTDATLIAGAASFPTSSSPTTPITPPTSALPAAIYPSPSLPPDMAAPPQAQKAGSPIWKILGIVAAIGLLTCLALSAGVYILARRGISEGQNMLATAGAGLATVAADPTLQAINTFPTAAAATRTGSVLYKQSFDQAGSDFDADETENATYSFVDGAYSITAKKPNLILWQKVKGDYGNAAISLDTTIKGPPESAAGLIFRYQDDQNFYLFTITGDARYSLDLYKDDKLTTLIDWTEASAINTAGQLNALRVETSGDTIRLYCNDELLDEISDSTFERGNAAIALNTFDDPNLTVVFDNLVIRSLK